MSRDDRVSLAEGWCVPFNAAVKAEITVKTPMDHEIERLPSKGC